MPAPQQPTWRSRRGRAATSLFSGNSDVRRRPRLVTRGTARTPSPMRGCLHGSRPMAVGNTRQESAMLNQTSRKSILALVALAALSSAVLVATDASARGFGGGGHSFGGGGGHFGGGFGGGLASRSLGGSFAGHGIGGNLAGGNIGHAPVLAGGNAGVHL